MNARRESIRPTNSLPADIILLPPLRSHNRSMSLQQQQQQYVRRRRPLFGAMNSNDFTLPIRRRWKTYIEAGITLSLLMNEL
jgi:hypothetical protein